MKSFTSTFALILGVALIGATIFYIGRRTAPQPSLAAAPPAPAEAPAAAATPPPPNPVRTVEPVAASPAPPARTVAVVPEEPPSALSFSKAALEKTLGILLQTNTPLKDKVAIWQDLRSKGLLDDAIANLKDAKANNPGNAAYATALAEGYYTKLQSVYGQVDNSTIAILALQTDQSLNDALKVDPASWEAQYVKADALSHWPAEMNKGPEVIQQLSNLIDQQGGQASQPQFAQSYILLGDEYQKLGQQNYATATWQLGLQNYPANETLQQRVKGGTP